MLNEVVWIVALLLSFIGVLTFYKLFGKTGLFVWIVIAIIAANIQAIKLVNLLGMETALGTIIYSTIFFAINVLNEKYGKKEVINGILIGAVSMLTMTILMGLGVLYSPSSNDFANESFRLIFSINLRITIGSLVAFLVSQYCNMTLYSKFKTKYKELWIRSNGSTIIAQLVDTVIFIGIAFSGVYSVGILISLLISRYIFKLIITVIWTPFMYKIIDIKPSKL